ncbi:MAG: TonB family protein [Acidobacteria bacterium]|nr:TonB family protein [Acidobacteriota bacterium]
MKLSRNLFQILMLCIVIAAIAPLSWAQDDVARAQEHYKRGKKLYRSGQTERAIEELYTALSVQEIYFEAQMLLARTLLETQRPREALAELRGVDALERGKVSYHKLLGKACYQSNKLREAERSLSYAIAEASHPDPELHYYLGLVELRRGNATNAIREAKRALEIAPRFAPARKLLSDAYLAGKDSAQAAQELTLYLRKVRNREEAATLRERLKAINSLSQAKPEGSVQTSFVPPQIHKVPKAFYTPEARRNRIEGAVKVEVLLGSDGSIEQVIVVQGLGFGLDEQAIIAAKGIGFTPGRNNDKPVSVWMGVYFIFILASDDEIQSSDKTKIATLTIHSDAIASQVAPGEGQAR